MKGLAGEKTMTDKTCLKKEDLAKDSFMFPNSASMTCTRAVTTNTSTQFVADITCAGAPGDEGARRHRRQGPAAFTGSMKMTTSAQGRAMDVSMKMTGKFLSADCGTVK